MELIQTLMKAGYELHLQRDGATEMVVATRTPDVKLSKAGHADLMLMLMRHQDEAIEFYKASRKQDAWKIAADIVTDKGSAARLEAQIRKGGMSEVNEAIAIVKFNIAIGMVKTSDDRLWVECLQELLNASR